MATVPPDRGLTTIPKLFPGEGRTTEVTPGTLLQSSEQLDSEFVLRDTVEADHWKPWSTDCLEHGHFPRLCPTTGSSHSQSTIHSDEPFEDIAISAWRRLFDLQIEPCLDRINQSQPKMNIRQVKERKADRGEYLASGRLAGANTEALVDTCSGVNFISALWLARRKIQYDRATTRQIIRADSSSFKTIGTVSLPWHFAGEQKVQMVEFGVLLNKACPSSVTFGSQFMRITRTLTHFRDRLRRRSRSGMPRVFYQSGSQLRMNGYCGGHAISALPDSCSDLPLVSPDFAQKLGFPIDYDDDCFIDLELPGQHRTRTRGMVRNVPWSFDLAGPTHYVDFYILDGLPGDVLLDEQFLHTTNAFEEFANHLVDIDENGIDGMVTIFLNIRIVRKMKTFFGKSKHREPPDTNESKVNAERIALLDKMEAILLSDAPKEQQEREIAELSRKYAQLCTSPGAAQPAP